VNIHSDILRRKLRSRMVLQVHDELVFDAHRDELDELKAMVEERMTRALPLQVPIEVGMGSGKNWLEAH
jgi:DNA polymerase-1